VRINRFIRAPEVRVISSKGEQLGVMDIRDAMRMAQDENLDIVEIAPNEVPPVCRIMDFGKYQYDENKKRRESKKKQTKVEVKECKFRPKIGDHDFYVRIRRAVQFLGKGNKVKLTVMFRGREHAHPEVAERLLLRAFEEIKDLGKLEAPPRKEGRDMYALVAPLPEDIRRKAMRLRAEKEPPEEKAKTSPKEKEAAKAKETPKQSEVSIEASAQKEAPAGEPG
jgi:translation initiation factor IF-3